MSFEGFGTENLRLPDRIDTYLATVASVLKSQGNLVAAELLKEAQAEVIPDSYETWDGGQYYYQLELSVPSDSLGNLVDTKSEIENKIAEQLKDIIRLPKEFVSSISLVVDTFRNSVTHPHLSGEDISRIWGNGKYRLFFSHKSSDKSDVSGIKKELFGMGLELSCFLAHEDIEPNELWQKEIELALNSMDTLVAFITTEFHSGSWTDQEIGFAISRGVPIYALKLGNSAPQGFQNKFQALSCNWDSAAKELTKCLFSQEKMVDAYIEAMRNCEKFEDANKLSNMLSDIKRCNKTQLNAMIDIYNNNIDISQAWGFNGSYPRTYGDGLPFHLKRLTGRNYHLDNYKIVEG